jgi:hypothetical protein
MGVVEKVGNWRLASERKKAHIGAQIGRPLPAAAGRHDGERVFPVGRVSLPESEDPTE